MNYRLIFAVLVVLIIVAVVVYINVPGELDLTAPSPPGVFKPPVTSSTPGASTPGSPTTTTPAATSGSSTAPPTSGDTSSGSVRTPDIPSPPLPYEEQETSTTPAPTSTTPTTSAPAPAPVPTQTYVPVVTPVMNAINNYRKILNAEFYGFDLPNGGTYGVSTEEQCAANCNSRPDCAFFSYRSTDGGCWLKAPTAENHNSVTAIKRGDGGYVSYPKTDVFGNDIADYSGITLTQCEQKCTENPKCDMYHSLNNNSCWLKAAAPTQGVNAYFRKSKYN